MGKLVKIGKRQMEKMRSEPEIRQEGMDALRSKLDPVETERFLMLVRRDEFDYTEWQRRIWKWSQIVTTSQKKYWINSIEDIIE